VSNCDEFIYYDDLVEATVGKPRTSGKKKKKAGRKAGAKSGAKAAEARQEDGGKGTRDQDEEPEALVKVVEIIRSLQADYDPLWGSLVKQTVRRVHPGFQEGHHGYRNFAELLEEIEDLGYVELDYDKTRGNYKVSWISR